MIHGTSNSTPSTHSSRVDAACGPCFSTLGELLRVCSIASTGHAPTGRGSDIQLNLRVVRAGQTLVYEGTRADSLFVVRSGTLKVCRIDHDGYEQVLAFAMRGEVLCFEVLCMASHPAAIVALEDSIVFVIPRRQIEALGAASPLFAVALQQAGSLALSRSRELVDILAAVASDVRLARFLLLHSRRMSECGQSPRQFRLRMGRRDIASLLGVAHETVSRGFGALAAMGLLRVEDRDVEILDMARLAAFTRSTRRPVALEVLMRKRDSGTAHRGATLRVLSA